MQGKSEKIYQGKFNLIKKEVSIRKKVKSEINWRLILNTLFFVVMVSLGAASYTFRVYINQELDIKKQELVAFANTNVNIPIKKDIKAKINTINDRFMLYEEVKDQNFDFAKFYDDFSRIYPFAQLNKISYNNGSEMIEVELLIPSNGYEEFPRFLRALKSDNRFKKAEIKSIIFLTSELSVNENYDVPLRLSLNIPKINITKNG